MRACGSAVWTAVRRQCSVTGPAFLRDLIFQTLWPLPANARYSPILCANVSGAGCESSSLIITVWEGHTLNAEPWAFSHPPCIKCIHVKYLECLPLCVSAPSRARGGLRPSEIWKWRPEKGKKPHQQIRKKTRILEAFTNAGNPFDHMRHDGEHSGFVCTSRLRLGRVFSWCPLLPDTFWLLTDEKVIFILWWYRTWAFLGEQGFAVCSYQRQ